MKRSKTLKPKKQTKKRKKLQNESPKKNYNINYDVNQMVPNSSRKHSNVQSPKSVVLNSKKHSNIQSPKSASKFESSTSKKRSVKSEKEVSTVALPCDTDAQNQNLPLVLDSELKPKLSQTQKDFNKRENK